jgi:hypothetical protein
MDVGTISLASSSNKEAIDDWFREILKNGLGERIMFGTDQMRWPETIGMAIGVIESTSSLTGAESAGTSCRTTRPVSCGCPRTAVAIDESTLFGRSLPPATAR